MSQPIKLNFNIKRNKTFFIIEKYCYNSVFFISNIVSEDKTKCLPYQEFQNKEEFEDIQGVFALFLFVYVEWCPTLIVLCFCFVCLRLVYPMLMLTRKLLNKRFLLVKLKSSLRTFYGRHHDLVDRYRISVSQMTADMFHFFN